jgi:hypothetical protein
MNHSLLADRRVALGNAALMAEHGGPQRASARGPRRSSVRAPR